MPLRKWGMQGTAMTSGDGTTHCVHPVLATYVRDYSEQVLVTGVKSGLCPVCTAPHTELRDFDADYPPHDISAILDILAATDGPNFARECENAEMKPIYRLFWEDLPYANIFTAITPDILHQGL